MCAAIIHLSSNAREILATMKRMPASMAQSVAAAMDAQNSETITQVIQTRMSFPSNGPVVAGSLRWDSGRAVKSIRMVAATVDGITVTGSMGSNLRYLKAHEEGYQGTVNVRAHTRRVFRHGTRLKKTFDKETQSITSKRVATKRLVKGMETPVKAHQMKMNLPARWMFRDTLTARAPIYSQAISQAIIDTWGNQGGQPIPRSANPYPGQTT